MNTLKALEIHIKTFNLFGCWPSETPSFFYHLRSLATLTFIFIGFSFTQLINCIFVQSVDVIVNSLIIAIAVAVVAFKGIIIYSQKKNVLRLFQIIRKMEKRIETPSHVDMFAVILKKCRRIYLLFISLYLSACGMIAVESTLTKAENRAWSSSYFYPYEWAHRPIILIGGIVYQGLTDTTCVFLAACVDTFGIILSCILIGHMVILCSELKNMRQIDIKELCQYYKDILISAKYLDKIMQSALLSQFAASGIVLCSCAYEFSTVALDEPSNIFFLVSYSMCMISQIFVPCYFGSLVTMKSSEISRSIYQSNWPNFTKRNNKSLLILMQRSNREVQFFAGGLFPLNLTSFLKILKSAYSMFALLKNA